MFSKILFVLGICILGIYLIYYLRCKLRILSLKDKIYFQGIKNYDNKLSSIIFVSDDIGINFILFTLFGGILFGMIQLVFFDLGLSSFLRQFSFFPGMVGFIIYSRKYHYLIITKKGVNVFFRFIDWEEIKSYNFKANDKLSINLSNSNKKYSIGIPKENIKEVEKLFKHYMI
ncbi:DUF5673 domain-containing protein [Halobacteroides halobius]|uniref:DUF5673 domain-containing protein n=1 Tax=Halobacteroides halobius TaxID=42422 RepID=UPI0012E9EB18|nr:DUF5673 domain-containing protein [Halobacteroides halobius]